MAPIASNSPWRKVPEHLADERRQARDAILTALGNPDGAGRKAALQTAERIAAVYDAAVDVPDASIGLGEARESVDKLARAARAFLAAARDVFDTGAWTYGGMATNDPVMPRTQKISLRDDDPLRQEIAEARRVVNDILPRIEARLQVDPERWPRSGQLKLDAMTIGTAKHDFVQACYEQLWRMHRGDERPGGDEGPFRRLVRGVYCLTHRHLIESNETFAGVIRKLSDRIRAK